MIHLTALKKTAQKIVALSQNIDKTY